MKEAGVHVGHDIVTIAGNRAGTMLVQVTIPALLGARRKSGRVQWWAVVTKAQICVILICKSESSRTSYIGYQHLYMYNIHESDTKEATYHPSLLGESQGVAVGGGHWTPISAAKQAS